MIKISKLMQERETKAKHQQMISGVRNLFSFSIFVKSINPDWSSNYIMLPGFNAFILDIYLPMGRYQFLGSYLFSICTLLHLWYIHSLLIIHFPDF